jgi:diguanylate cyclase (GGDEF)-like protein
VDLRRIKKSKKGRAGRKAAEARSAAQPAEPVAAAPAEAPAAPAEPAAAPAGPVADTVSAADAAAAVLKAAEQRVAAAEALVKAASDKAEIAEAMYRAAVKRGELAEARERAALERVLTVEAREQAANERDLLAAARDRAAAERDVIANKRDRIAMRREKRAKARPAVGVMTVADSANDGELERARLEAELQRAHLDALTGAFRREVGRLALRNEIERARRADGKFVIAFIDVDGLKGVNDREGHAAGDRVLRMLGATIRANLRSYDPVVRYGGDEFVCGIASVDPAEVQHRIAVIDQSLRHATGVGITAGLATLTSNESLDELTARADEALLAAKRSRTE